ncbi:MAG: NAD-dependent protein deacetylase [Euzebya sp.]
MDLVTLLMTHSPMTVLSGAGISTDSGIPDYRGTGADRRRAPITFREFTHDPGARRRYWARSHAGYQYMRQAQPNRGHVAVTHLQHRGVVQHVITQNVDGLHQMAGTQNVLDVHGRIDRVRCMACDQVTSRDEFGQRLQRANRLFVAHGVQQAPDGDADLSHQQVADFVVPSCTNCAGILKPDVVFFGESMPRSRRDHASAWISGSGGLLVLGSSLAVMSGYRLVLQATNAGQPIAILTRGPSRGDHLATVRIDADLTDVLTNTVERLSLAADSSTGR